MESTDRIEIRLLGPLHVRRSDSSVVEPGAWRTGKTLDLLRLLALDADQPVRVASLLEKLWPDVDEAHGRASLRTAASQLRRALRSDCIERRLGGLVLRHAWVDATAFRSLATEAKAALRERRLARVVALTREAEALYVDDFTAHDDGSAWALEARESLAAVRRALLVDAAECAIELHWMRDGVELANKALAVDSCAERAHRALIQAYAGLGETEQALRAFERCRQMLAEELGADPSAQTRAVHMQVLAGHQETPKALPFVGRESDLTRLVGVLTRSISTPAPALVCVSGTRGAGREAMLREAVNRVGARRTQVTTGPSGLPTSADLHRPSTKGESLVLVVPPLDELAEHDAVDLVRTVSTLDPVVTVATAVSPDAAKMLSEASVRAGADPVPVVEIGPLLQDDLAALASAVLSGPVTPELVAALHKEANGLVEQSISVLRTWLSSGRITSTAKGLALAPPMHEDNADLTVQPLVRRVLEQLTPTELEALHMTALIARPVTPAMITPLVAGSEAEGDTSDPGDVVSPLLDRLVDFGVLSLDTRGYAFRSPLVQDAVASWIRPTVRRRLHWRIAEEGHLPTEDRVRHWLEAGESQLACAAALEAANAALTQGRPFDARAHLNQMISLADGLDSSPTDQAAVFEMLGDTCLACGLREDAKQAFTVALTAATTMGLPSTARLSGKVEAAERGEVVHDDNESVLLQLTPASGCSPEVEDALREALEQAQDNVTRVEARLRLGEIVALPRRDLSLARRLADEATLLAETPEQAARACMLRHLPDVLLGSSGHTAVDALQHAVAQSADCHDEDLTAALNLTWALAAHHRGLASFGEIAARVDLERPGPAGLDPGTALLRAYAERGMLTEAKKLASAAKPQTSPLAEQARLLSIAVLQEALEEQDKALDTLREAVDHAIATDCLLQLPEIVARTIRLEVGEDQQSAVEHFELFDWAVGGSTDQANETCAKLLARAAVRGVRREYDRAAAAAAIAAEIAEKQEAPLLAAQAHLARAGYLEQTSHHNEIRLAYASAVRWYRAAGVDRLARRAERTVRPQTRAS
jgi:DNA-binding SARP family transcriptional activator